MTENVHEAPLDPAGSTAGPGRAAAPAAARYPMLSVIVLTVGVVVLTLALVVIAAGSQNRLAGQSEQHLVASALRGERDRVSGFVVDYAFWNDSAQHLAADLDREWAEVNIGPDSTDNLAVTAALVIDGAGRPLFANIDGVVQEPESPARMSEELAFLVQEARDGAGEPGVRPLVVSTYLLLDGVPAIAVAAAVKWEDARPIPLVAGRPVVLAFVRRVDSDLLGRFEELFLLPGLRLADAGEVSRNSTVLTSMTGRSLARLVWTGARPGTQLIEELALPVAGILVLATGLLVVIVRRARRSADELARSHAQLAVHAAALKDSTTAMRAALVEAAAASAAKSDFLARMSHELRTPLNAIVGFSELIATRFHGTGAADRYCEYGQMIHDSGRHLLSLINDILDLSRIEAGRVDLYEEVVDLDTILADCRVLLAPTVQAKRLVLTCERSDVRLFADPRAVKQILLNLLSNAVKFTPEGGSVRVAAIDRGEGVTVSVADSGCGMSAADVSGVFRQFGRARASIAHDGEGSGLGLNISKGLAELHGGKLTLRSELGAGTTVEVWFPASRSRTAPIPLAAR